MKKVKIGLIGAGSIAQNFHLPILSRLGNAEIVAIYDRQRSKARLLAERYDIKYVCDTVSDLVAIDELHAVDVCTSTDLHAENTIAALEAKKDVFVEKPAARNYQETLLMKQAADRNGRTVTVGMNQRFRYDAKVLKNYVDTGEVGKVFYVQAGWLQEKRDRQWHSQIIKSGGGVLIDLGISIIDSLLWIFDFAKVRSVQASTFHHVTKDVEDVCVASMRFEDGSVATFEVSWTLFSQKRHFFTNVYGSEGSVMINPIRLFKSNGDVFEPVKRLEPLSKIAIHKKSFESELKHFVNSILGFGPVISSIDEAVKTMKIVDAMYKSAEEGAEVVL